MMVTSAPPYYDNLHILNKSEKSPFLLFFSCKMNAEVWVSRDAALYSQTHVKSAPTFRHLEKLPSVHPE